jgi:hypothetical protein
MSVYTQFRAGLAADSGIAALVSTRIYPLNLPQEPTYGAITYRRVSNSGQDGTSNRKESRWQVDCWSSTYVGSQAIAAAVKAFVEEWHDSPGIEWARAVNEIDDYDDAAKVYRIIVDVILHTTGD